MFNQHKPICSFVRRERRAIHKDFPQPIWSQYQLFFDSIINFEQDFFQTHPIILDVGFGAGDALFSQAQSNPNEKYVGIEVYKTGIANLLRQLSTLPLENIKLIEGDAFHILSKYIPDNSIDRVQVLFPDPWPKQRHHKRRLVQLDFIRLVYRILKPQGELWLATDWQHYAEAMIATLKHSPFISKKVPHQFSERFNQIPLTKFEKRGKLLGHPMYYLQYKKDL